MSNLYMRKINIKILIGITILLWIVYFIQCYLNYAKKEPFIQKIYRPYIREINKKYETFIDNYGPNVVHTKLKKWHIL